MDINLDISIISNHSSIAAKIDNMGHKLTIKIDQDTKAAFELGPLSNRSIRSSSAREETNKTNALVNAYNEVNSNLREIISKSNEKLNDLLHQEEKITTNRNVLIEDPIYNHLNQHQNLHQNNPNPNNDSLSLSSNYQDSLEENDAAHHQYHRPISIVKHVLPDFVDARQANKIEQSTRFQVDVVS